MSALDLLQLKPLAHHWHHHARDLAAALDAVRRQATTLRWNSPAGRAAAASIEGVLAAARRCEQECTELALALERHREAAHRSLERVERAEHLALVPAHVVVDVMRRLP